MKCLIAITIVFLTLNGLSFEQDPNEKEIRKYLDDEIYFGKFKLRDYLKEKLTKEEYQFRREFKMRYLTFLTDFGNVNGVKMNLSINNLTDLFISQTYSDMFEELENVPESEISEFVKITKIDSIRFKNTMDDCKRFVKNWQNSKGTYERTTWLVKSEGDEMDLYFYLNEKMR